MFWGTILNFISIIFNLDRSSTVFGWPDWYINYQCHG